MITGLFEKVFLADTLLAHVSDSVYSKVAQTGFIDAWVGTLAFSSQIFFDFAGYSSCAIGVALCLGFVLPDNFRFPYGAIGFSDFWQRWHISLSSWLRDYLYIPLGGNKKGSARTRINLMLTMLIGGLWHGASWLFVAWGGLHGMFLIIEQFIKKRWGYLHIEKQVILSFFLSAFTYILIVITWVFFRAQNFPDAFKILYQMFHFNFSNVLGPADIIIVLIVSIGLFIFHFIMRNSSFEMLIHRTPLFARALFLSILIITLILTPGDDRAFIYFQF